MRLLVIFIFLLANVAGYCQNRIEKIIGRYSDDITELELRPDSTYVLKTPDYVFPYTYRSYQNQGSWILAGDAVILNPDKKPRLPVVSLTERVISGRDSIEIKIMYETEVYQNEVLIGQEPTDFKLMTLYLNKPKNYHHLVHDTVRRICAFSPRVKKQYVVDSSNTVKLAKQKVEKIGVYTYGFLKTIELIPTNPNSNYYEIKIVQPIDKERTPRSKKVIIKGDKAFFYEYHGHVPTSGSLLNSLKRTD